MEPYDSDTEGDEQETPLLPGGHEVTFQKAHKGTFFCSFVCLMRQPFKSSDCRQLKRNPSIFQFVCSLGKSLYSRLEFMVWRTSKLADVHTKLILMGKSVFKQRRCLHTNEINNEILALINILTKKSCQGIIHTYILHFRRFYICLST